MQSSDCEFGGRAGKVANILSAMICSQQLLPGTKLGEGALAEVFGVSRPVVRQAMILLAESRLVMIERNKGAFVHTVEFQEGIDVCEALIAIEQAAVFRVSARLGLFGEKTLTRRMGDHFRALETSSGEELAKVACNLFVPFVQLTENKLVLSMHARLVRRALVFQSSDGLDFDRKKLSSLFYRTISHLLRGDARRVASNIRRHRISLLGRGLSPAPLLSNLTPDETRSFLATAIENASHTL